MLGLLLLIDFMKAFNSIVWTSIQEAFNFRESISKLVEAFVKNIKSVNNHRSNIPQHFGISGGFRHRDTISSHICI